VYDFDEGEEGGIALVSTTVWVCISVKRASAPVL
jgi:hypothetical protein